MKYRYNTLYKYFGHINMGCCFRFGIKDILPYYRNIAQEGAKLSA